MISAIGFRKYVLFIPIGYGFSIAGIGAFLLAVFHANMDAGMRIVCLLLLVYGCRLGGFLTVREVKSTSYNRKMQSEIKDDKSMPVIDKIGIWISAAFLYACETAPITFRMVQDVKTNISLLVGITIMIAGICLESLADFEKNKAKKENPGRFVDSGLYRLVRCPNYFGELLFWTGVFISGIGTLHGTGEWIFSILGYAGIIYFVFGSARRIELRQSWIYGADSEYLKYVKGIPIMIPFVSLLSSHTQNCLEIKSGLSKLKSRTIVNIRIRSRFFRQIIFVFWTIFYLRRQLNC